jgi:glutaryl-CoA dehydrogenase
MNQPTASTSTAQTPAARDAETIDPIIADEAFGTSETHHPYSQNRHYVSELLNVEALLTDDELLILERVREYCANAIRPVVDACWLRGEFPRDVATGLGTLGIGGLHAGKQNLLAGLVAVELARADLSLSLFFGVHDGLHIGAIERFGSKEQKQRFLPDAKALRTIGAFALTEPDSGSDISRSMKTTARRDGDDWVLNGRKYWIGNGSIADNLIVWANADGEKGLRGFIVPRSAKGYEATVIDDKISARIIQNADITLDNVRISEDRRLPDVMSFREINTLLLHSRVWVGWQAVGLQYAALDAAIHRAHTRAQFGKPIGAFQLVQEKLARMIGNTSSSLALMVQLARAEADETATIELAAVAKASISLRARETAALGRDIGGGNGIRVNSGAAKVFADTEALYTYEGSYDMNCLIVGRHVTGYSAFN